MESCTLCEHWSAHKAHASRPAHARRAGAQGGRPLRAEPAGRHRPLDRTTGAIVLRRAARRARSATPARSCWPRGEVDLSLLDARSTTLVYKLAITMPGCLTQDDRERAQAQARALGPQPRDATAPGSALNMMTEGARGLPRLPRGQKDCREADFLLLRRRLAEGADVGRRARRGDARRGPTAAMRRPTPSTAPAPVQLRIRALAPRDLAGVVRIDAHPHRRAQAGLLEADLSRVPRAGARPRARRPRRRGGRRARRLSCSARCAPSSSAPSPAAGSSRSASIRARRGTASASALLDEACRRFRALACRTVRTMVRRNDVPVLTFFRANGFAGGRTCSSRWTCGAE